MKQNRASQSGLFHPRVLLAFALCSAGALLAMLSFAATPPSGMTGSRTNSPGDSLFVDKHAGPLRGNKGASPSMPLAPPQAGTWSIVTSPNSSVTQTNYLQAVTCVSASDCWAVGFYFTGSNVYQTLIERWDGTSWAIVTSPNNSALPNSYLYGVTCVSASDCWAVGYYNVGVVAQTLIEHYTVPPIPTSVVSRKTHGTAGDFDIDLPLTGTPGIECRSGSVPDSHQVVTTFAAPVTVTNATVTPGPGGTASISLVPGFNHSQVIVTLSNVSNVQTLTINLLGVSDGSNTGDVHIPMSVLIGDTSANGSVNSSDISQTKAQSGTIPTASTFRTDVTVNGLINSSDISTVKAKSGTALP